MSNIYLQNRYNDPKDVFKMIYKIINNYNKDKNLKIIDFGGAEGAFAYFVLNKQPNYEITNLEYDKKLLALSKKNVPLCNSVIIEI